MLGSSDGEMVHIYLRQNGIQGNTKCVVAVHACACVTR